MTETTGPPRGAGNTERGTNRMKAYYTTWGPVTGTCGHKHQTAAAAFACSSQHISRCKARGGISDRQTYLVDRGKPYWDGKPGTLCHYGED